MLQKTDLSLNPSTGIKVTWAPITPMPWEAEVGRLWDSLAAGLAPGSVKGPASRIESDRAPSSGLHVSTQEHMHLYHAQLIESRWHKMVS